MLFFFNHTLSGWLPRLTGAKERHADQRSTGWGVPTVTQTFKAENAASRSPRGRRAFLVLQDSPSLGPAQPCPALPCPALPSPADPQAASRPLRDPGAASPNPAGGRPATQPGLGRAGQPGQRGYQTHHGRRAASAPTAQSHKAPATPVVLVTPAGRPAPSLRWAQEAAIGGGRARDAQGRCPLDRPLRPPRLGSWAGPLRLSCFASGPSSP